MSLKGYRMPRMVALKSSTPVLEAARAIENNNIGAIIVQDDGCVVGMVTDRDLAVRVLGRGLDAKTTPLAAVMTTPVTTLSPADTQSQAIRLMQQRNIRRIPLVEAGRLVGIVTLDDLLLDEAAPLDQLSAVVEAQIGAGAWATALLRSSGTQRAAARAQATYGRMLNQLRVDADLETSERAETALVTVLESLVRRLTPGEAKDLIAQLPSLLHASLRAAVD
jgi:CBS domain-containing protein